MNYITYSVMFQLSYSYKAFRVTNVTAPINPALKRLPAVTLARDSSVTAVTHTTTEKTYQRDSVTSVTQHIR